jgi:hypothetical protein
MTEKTTVSYEFSAEVFDALQTFQADASNRNDKLTFDEVVQKVVERGISAIRNSWKSADKNQAARELQRAASSVQAKFRIQITPEVLEHLAKLAAQAQ